MPDKITLDRETFKVLAADTRIEILKRLERHKETLTDIAEGMGMSPSTIKEHLDKLVSVGLIEAEDKGTKWKYYRLTRKGRDILNPHEKKVWFLLGITMLFLFGATYGLLSELGPVAVPSAVSGGEIQEEVFAAKREMDFVAEEGGKGEGVRTEAEEKEVVTAAAPSFSVPYLELAAVVALALIAGACVGYLARKRM